MKTRILFLFFIAVAFAGCKSSPQQDGEQANNQWKTMTVKRGDTELSQLFSASIQGRRDIEIRPQIQGKIVELKVNEGQQVHRGQTLFVIDPMPYRMALEQASAQVKAARASLATARLNYESRQRLYNEKVVSEYDLQTAHNTLLDAEAQVALAVAAESNARNDLSYTQVNSPADGVVGILPYRQGTLVGPDIAQPLTTVSDNSEMYVYFSMDENRLLGMLRRFGSTEKALNEMDSVSLMLSDGGMYESKGRISSISGVINKSTGSVSLRADFPNPNRLLHTGATGNVVLKNQYKDVIIIPQSSTVTLQDKMVVYRVIDGKAVSTIITVDSNNDGRNYIVLSGLNPGDVIIADGAGMVQEGMEVK